MKTNRTNSDEMLSAGIDYHKRYSVVHVLDAAGGTVKKGRVEPNSEAAFAAFFSGFGEACVRCVFEASMNWGYLYDLLEEQPAVAGRAAAADWAFLAWSLPFVSTYRPRPGPPGNCWI